ncbi:type III-B CRISPR-associated protein Cas10/Cmr2 [Calothrix sp. UHCC 0171]|uniref:type III-B CRISPR-associated protein Cas10/Cmr2 n=1 Tax=Calothrix sp. UHCC 0171 TaxID=3110245 RepID=UPI002B20E011|nr:type III-B CRISPR-associated protein Cas10/Cmr2 [Calothrix sp. UHCC 0171]MEA5573539.1 type III-B CRISPR-associated protein Cas10/Cmr2 [Calothrix sp. UHCC 0171]
MADKMHPISIGIAWCLAWGEEKTPKYGLDILQQMREALQKGEKAPEQVLDVVNTVEELKGLEDIKKFPKTLNELKELTEKYPLLWNSRIGLVYGGATKIKQYVFEESKLPDIRGASALLDRINLVDLPAFFGVTPKYIPKTSTHNYQLQCDEVRRWLNNNYLKQSDDEKSICEALIPELIIYSTGGNILAFCPAAFVDDLANAIEKRYTCETLTANSCAVGDRFKILEIAFGLLRDNIEDTFWLDRYQKEYKNPIVEGLFGKVENDSQAIENFKNRKSFNELTTKLAILFNQRRSGNETPNRPSRRYPPMLDTHPYLRRDEVEKRSAIAHITQLTGQPYLSEASLRKRCIGDRAKKGEIPSWYTELKLDWQPGIIESWTNKFEIFLKQNPDKHQKYCKNYHLEDIETSPSLTHLSKVSNGFVAYIYADGNNMGGYIQKIRTPEAYQNFSQDVDNATKYSVFHALANNLHPRQLQGIDESTSRLNNGDFIHPFEIITIGGDDIILIVPADKALEIAKDIGGNFENILLGNLSIPGEEIKDKDNYKITTEKPVDLQVIHRYQWQKAKPTQCKLSISSGVLITSYNTPIYYAEDLTTQLMKSAKDYAKKIKKYEYFGGTVDFLTMKSVTMLSSSIKDFREKALIKKQGAEIKLYAAPYTLHELGGLIASIKALIAADFPKSQLYQIRDFLAKGRRTASLNYCYFRYRLKQGQTQLREDFEKAWCDAKTNEGNIAPWMYENRFGEKYYETIWREMVDLYEFIKTKEEDNDESQQTAANISNTPK